MVLFLPLLCEIFIEFTIPLIYCPLFSLKLYINICIYSCCNLILSNLQFALRGSEIRICALNFSFDAKLELELSLSVLSTFDKYTAWWLFWNIWIWYKFQAQPPRMSIVMELAFLCYLHSLKLITVSPIDFLIFNYCSIVTETTLFDCVLCKFKRCIYVSCFIVQIKSN